MLKTLREQQHVFLELRENDAFYSSEAQAGLAQNPVVDHVQPYSLLKQKRSLSGIILLPHKIIGLVSLSVSGKLL